VAGESTIGLMASSSRANGKETKCTAMGFSLGKTVNGTKVSSLTINVRDKAPLPGVTAASTLANGNSGSSTEVVHT